jgi:hypothetical protein
MQYTMGIQMKPLHRLSNRLSATLGVAGGWNPVAGASMK